MGKRPKMLASVIREIIAPFLTHCPHECGIVSITDVVVSDDFSHVTVYVSALEEQLLALGYLESRSSAMQSAVSKKLARARVPKLRFRIDETIEKANRLDDLLK